MVVVVVIIAMAAPVPPVHSAASPRTAVDRATKTGAERFKSQARIGMVFEGCGMRLVRVKWIDKNVAETVANWRSRCLLSGPLRCE